jgi:hypothetical protein
MKKVFLALLLAATMMIAAVGTVSATAQSSTHSSVPTYAVKTASFSGHYTGIEVVKTADIFTVTRTKGTYSGSGSLTFHGKTITGTASGTGQGQFFGAQQGPYTSTVTATFKSTLIGKSVHGTFSADINIPGVGITHVAGPMHGTLDGNKMNVQWSSHVMQKADGSITVTNFNGIIKFVIA